jgi:hypothetical protein
MQKENLLKAKALSNITLAEDFLDFDEEDVHSYLWSLSDFILNAYKFNSMCLKRFINEIDNNKCFQK